VFDANFYRYIQDKTGETQA